MLTAETDFHRGERIIRCNQWPVVVVEGVALTVVVGVVLTVVLVDVVLDTVVAVYRTHGSDYDAMNDWYAT
jgi:hypothetical protein